MSLLKTIRDETLKDDCDVASLLRKCKVLAVTLGSQELETWASHELLGYAEGMSTPAYRVLRAHSKGHFLGVDGSEFQNADIPVHALPKEYRELYRTIAFNQGVGALQEMVRRGCGTTNLQVPWPAEALSLFGKDMYEDMTCVQAWKFVSVGGVHGILDTVKTKVLEFALELQKGHPELMTNSENLTHPPTREEVKNYFNTTIHGNVGAIANASSQFSQNVQVAAGDLNGLRNRLTEGGVPTEAIDELEEALKSEAAASVATGGLGPKVKAWLGDLMLKAGSGTWQVALDTAATVVPAAIAGYLGISL